MKKVSVVFLGLGFLLALIGMSLGEPGPAVSEEEAAVASPSFNFRMVRSTGAVAANCLQGARADVSVVSRGPVEVMTVDLEGLPPNTDFDFFVLQIPNAPFGMAWYQGDIETNRLGEGHGRFVGRFNVETFVVAQPPGGQAAPVVHHQLPFPDASMNPATEPIHMYHLGLWFNSPQDAMAAGCPDTVTRFNGEHNAGIQALSTRNFSDSQVPLRHLRP